MPALPSTSQPMSAQPVKSDSVLPTWMTASIPSRGRGRPHADPTRDARATIRPRAGRGRCTGRTPARPAHVPARAARLRASGSVRSTTATGCRRSRGRRAARRGRRCSARWPRPVGARHELELLPVAAGVHEAVVDPDAVHPRDALARRRVVQRMQHHRAAADLGHAHERGQQLVRGRPVGLGQRAQQVAGDAEREHVDARRQVGEPRLERMLPLVVGDGFPVRVDVDDHVDPWSDGERPTQNVTPLSFSWPGCGQANAGSTSAAKRS